MEKSRFMGVELYGKTLGLIGCGNIGSIVATAPFGLKMKVIAYDPFLSPDRALALGSRRSSSTGCFQRADFLTLQHAADRPNPQHRRRPRRSRNEAGGADHQLAPAAG